MTQEQQILRVLDDAASAFTFPMLDNGYIYPAAARLSVHRSERDWALVIETFGFSPRAGIPDVWVSTFASRIHDRRAPNDFVDHQAFEQYQNQHQHDEAVSYFPIDEGDWQDPEDAEAVRAGATGVTVRGKTDPSTEHR